MAHRQPVLPATRKGPISVSLTATPAPEPLLPGPNPTKKRKFGDKTGTGSPSRHSIRRAKAATIIAEKILGKTDKAIGQKLNMHPGTVVNTVKWAEKHGMIDRYEQRVVDELVPLALEAYRQALKAGDTYVATEVLKGAGILKKQTDRAQQLGTEDEVLVWVKKRQENKPAIDISPTNPSGDALGGSTPLALPQPTPSIEADFSAIDGESGLEGTEGLELADNLADDVERTK